MKHSLRQPAKRKRALQGCNPPGITGRDSDGMSIGGWLFQGHLPSLIQMGQKSFLSLPHALRKPKLYNLPTIDFQDSRFSAPRGRGPGGWGPTSHDV